MMQRGGGSTATDGRHYLGEHPCLSNPAGFCFPEARRSFIEGTGRYPKVTGIALMAIFQAQSVKLMKRDGNERQGAAIWYASSAGIRHNYL